MSYKVFDKIERLYLYNMMINNIIQKCSIFINKNKI